MESIVEIILSLSLVTVFVLNYDVKALQCYECNKDFLYDPKCNNISKNQQNYLVDCNSSAVQCLRVINYGQSFVQGSSEDSSNEYDEIDNGSENEVVTSRRCASEESVNWCLSLSYPSVNCVLCNTTGCNGYDLNPLI